jgi:hypothetical protein
MSSDRREDLQSTFLMVISNQIWHKYNNTITKFDDNIISDQLSLTCLSNSVLVAREHSLKL